jgi:hypothetical protein
LERTCAGVIPGFRRDSKAQSVKNKATNNPYKTTDSASTDTAATVTIFHFLLIAILTASHSRPLLQLP